MDGHKTQGEKRPRFFAVRAVVLGVGVHLASGLSSIDLSRSLSLYDDRKSDLSKQTRRPLELSEIVLSFHSSWILSETATDTPLVSSPGSPRI